MRRVAIASHVALIDGKEYDGIGNILTETLNDIPTDFYMVRHSMEGGLLSVVRSYSGGLSVYENRLTVPRRPGPLRYAAEIISSVYYFTFCKKVDVYIGVDPLNALAGVMLKKLRRVDSCVFYTPDYSPQRFASRLLNRIYHAIDGYCVRQSDEVWSVSSRIMQIRKDMGLPKRKSIFVPNVPPEKFSNLKLGKRDKYSLVTLGIIDKQLDNEGVIRAVAGLKDKYPKLSFTIIGNGPDEVRLKKLAATLGIRDRVHFTGKLPFNESLALVAGAGIGLALYTGTWGFNQYGDSTKCREFFFFGLPVISTNTHSTVEDIRQYSAGIVVEQGVDQYMESIEAIIGSYGVYSRKSSRLGEKYRGVHKLHLQRILSS